MSCGPNSWPYVCQELGLLKADDKIDAFCQSNFNSKLVMSHKERHLSNCKMRTVSFVEHLEFEITGNVFSKAIALGDVDNDQVHVSI